LSNPNSNRIGVGESPPISTCNYEPDSVGDYRDGHNFYEASFVGDNAFETKGEDEKTDASGNKVRVARVLHEKQIVNYVVKVWREYKVGDDKRCTAEKAKELYDTL